MKKLFVNYVGVENEPTLNLNLTPPVKEKEDKNTVIVEDHHTTTELPKAGNKVEIDADVLEVLVSYAKEKKNGGNSDSNDKLAAAIEKLAEASLNANDSADNRFLGRRPVESVRIDKDDVMDGFAIFFAKSVSFALYDDQRNGFTIKTPYGRAFKFKTLQRVVDKASTRTPVYMSLSAVVIKSKKEAQWLREHTLFGIKFFERKDDGKEISEDLADKIVKAWQIVSQMDDHTVLQRCIGEGMDVDTPEQSKLRKKLAFKIAQNLSRDEERLRKRPVDDLNNKISNNIQNADSQQFAQPSATY